MYVCILKLIKINQGMYVCMYVGEMTVIVLDIIVGCRPCVRVHFRLTRNENSIKVLFCQVPAAQIVLLIIRPTFKEKYFRFDNCGRSWAGWCPRRSNGATGTRTARGTSAWSLGYTHHICSSCCIPNSHITMKWILVRRDKKFVSRYWFWVI